MKKSYLLSTILLIMLIGCQSSPTEQPAVEEEQQAQSSDEGNDGTEQSVRDEQNSEMVITVEEIQQIIENGDTSFETQSPLVGVGDTYEAFVDFFGEPDEGAGIYYLFLNSYMPLLVNEVNDVMQVVGVHLIFEKTDYPARTLEETMEEIAAFIPTDAEEIDFYELPNGHGVEYYYESNYIADVFRDHIFELEEPGGFSVQATYASGSQKELFREVVVTVGYKEDPEGEEDR
ncbi:hypothetical protein ACERJO_18765 [Halalkalibacter sp. AB-rgal2]|uniref:hypothetical protein n=1 Tax=Halalkalibacter sp. AB-rgal2 TaxID=3242695 RepID=UPI00359CC82F